jgi:hypothetical protein
VRSSVTEEPWSISRTAVIRRPSDYQLFSKPKENVGSKNFKEICETESGVTGWLTANRHGLVSTGNRKASLPSTCLSFGTVCVCVCVCVCMCVERGSWIAVELNLECSD